MKLSSRKIISVLSVPRSLSWKSSFSMSFIKWLLEVSQSSFWLLGRSKFQKKKKTESPLQQSNTRKHPHRPNQAISKQMPLARTCSKSTASGFHLTLALTTTQTKALMDILHAKIIANRSSPDGLDSARCISLRLRVSFNRYRVVDIDLDR